jgi:hypothetical protein
MKTEVHNALVHAAMELRGSAPIAWQNFVKAVGSHAGAQTTAVLSSSLEELPNAQGRAQSLHELARLLENAPTQYERIRK